MSFLLEIIDLTYFSFLFYFLFFIFYFLLDLGLKYSMIVTVTYQLKSYNYIL